MCWVSNGLRDWPEAERFGGSEGCGVNHSLLVLKIFVESQQETGALAMSNGASHRAFVILAPLRRFNDGEGVSRIKDGIAEQKIQRAVILRRPAFGDDLQPGPTGARKVRRVWVVVDLHFLNRGRSDSRSIRFNTVHHERDAVSARRIV